MKISYATPSDARFPRSLRTDHRGTVPLACRANFGEKGIDCASSTESRENSVWGPYWRSRSVECSFCRRQFERRETSPGKGSYRPTGGAGTLQPVGDENRKIEASYIKVIISWLKIHEERERERIRKSRVQIDRWKKRNKTSIEEREREMWRNKSEEGESKKDKYRKPRERCRVHKSPISPLDDLFLWKSSPYAFFYDLRDKTT